MENFSEITNFNATPSHIYDGQIWVRSDVKLHVGALLGLKKQNHDLQQERLSIKTADKQVSLDMDADMRKSSQVLAKGTVYGKPSTWKLEVTHNSLFGLNKSCLNTNGTINYQTVIKRMREVVHSVEIREQRLNKYFDTVYSDGFYDNMTSLLVVFQQKMQLLDIINKMNTYDHEITITLSQAHLVLLEEKGDQTKFFLKLMHGHPDGYGFYPNDVGTWILMEKLKYWFEELPEHVTRNPDAIRANESEKYQFKANIKIWKMYNYDDGHNQSGKNFGAHFGFIKGRFAVPAHVSYTTTEDAVQLMDVEKIYPETDTAIKALSNFAGALNLSGFSSFEANILSTMLCGNRRLTPFLIDQDIDLRTGRCMVRAFNAPPFTGGRQPYTIKDLRGTYNKLVRNHRLHEESKQATLLLRYWVAQPATETVESHWWTHCDRSLRLPRLGMARANLPELMAGDGVCISDDASTMLSTLVGPGRCNIFYSLFLNTSWYWGEFMSIYNTTNTHDLIKKINNYDPALLDETVRADALVSAVVGKRVLRCTFRDCYTYMDFGLESQFNKFIPFGKLNLPHLEDYGYKTNNDQVTFEKLVAPSCVTLILGLNGSLLEGTPYSASFNINPVVPVDDFGVFREGLNYQDLWGYGVLARWNGHDVYYKHPRTNSKHKIYAANDISIAVPPVPPYGVRRAESYQLAGISYRDMSWGGNFDWALQQGLCCWWERKQVCLLDAPKWGAAKAPYTESRMKLEPILKIDTALVENYMGAILSRYDVHLSDFQVSLTRPGVAVPGDQNPSSLLPEETPPDPGIEDTALQTED